MTTEDEEPGTRPVAYEIEIRVEGTVKVMVTAASRAEAATKVKMERDYISVHDATVVGVQVKEPRPRYEGNDPKIGVHIGHCCVIDGCKYGDEDCPVVTEKYAQSYPCEDCHNRTDRNGYY